MVSNHRREAERLGLDVSKVSCPFRFGFNCKFECDNIRKDRLTKHLTNIHKASRENISFF